MQYSLGECFDTTVTALANSKYDWFDREPFFTLLGPLQPVSCLLDALTLHTCAAVNSAVSIRAVRQYRRCLSTEKGGPGGPFYATLDRTFCCIPASCSRFDCVQKYFVFAFSHPKKSEINRISWSEMPRPSPLAAKRPVSRGTEAGTFRHEKNINF